MNSTWRDSFIESAEVVLEKKKRRYEQAVVKHLLKLCGLKALEQGLRNECFQIWNDRQLRFSQFHSMTGFPIWLVPRGFPAIHSISLAQVLTGSLFIDLYKDCLSQTDATTTEFADSPLGIVFPSVGMKFLVVHNRPSTSTRKSTRFKVPLDDGGDVLIIERLDDLVMDLLAEHGKPDSWRVTDA